MNYDSFLRFIFPDGMFDYFEMTRFNELPDKVEIYFAEKNNPPEEYAKDKLESKGFFISRSAVWYNHTQSKDVSRDWNLTAQGTQISSEFASFLKAMDRLSRRYNSKNHTNTLSENFGFL